MSPVNRPGGRVKRTGSGGGNAYRRGSGLGTGSVGNGPRGSSGGSFSGGGDRGSGGGGLLAVILALLIGGATNNNSGGTNKRGCLGRILILALIVVGVVFLLNYCSGGTSGGFLSELGGLLGTESTSDGSSSTLGDLTGGASDSSTGTTDSAGSLLESLLGAYGGTTG